MHKIFLNLLVASFLIISCKKEKIEAPESILNLINNYKGDCVCMPFINKYLWRGDIVYVYSCRGPMCLCKSDYYNEKGEKMTMDPSYRPDDFYRESRLIKKIWSCE